jgi:SAM-dependent methyltransferase
VTTRHLDLGCGASPRNPYQRDEVHAVDLAKPEGLEARLFRRANLSLEAIPHPDSSFESVSAFDFLEHIPRVLGCADGLGTRFPFVELMNEIYRVLKPAGRFYALTPAYPRIEAFQDPTHVNIITCTTWEYFCSPSHGARMYGYNGNFNLLRNEWALHPEAFSADPEMTLMRRFKRWRRARRGELSHLLWEFSCVKSTS